MYCNSSEVLKYLGKDAYTKIRSEVVGTGTGVISTWELDHDNVLSSSQTLYTDSISVSTGSYTLNLDDGTITGLTASSGSVLTANYDYSDIPDSIVQQMISSSDSLIDTETGRNFGNNTGSVEYLDIEEKQTTFFLKNYPIITLSSVERNKSVQTSAPDWETLTGGLGEDYISNSEDLSLGRIRFIDNLPYIGQDNLKVTYDHGYTTTPSLVKELSILLTIRQMTNSAVYKSMFKGYDNFTPVRLEEIENRIEELKRILKKQSINLV
ncbi:MAG TPA: hypothetical protein VMX17_03235 [Candidatus Glassbacteria bacterium]|nr:hypothetical protein [Candidatus Glassbacteria bacterium]